MFQVDNFSLTNTSITGMMKGIAAIICCMPHEDIAAATKQVCAIQVKQLCMLIEKNAPPVRESKADPIIWLDRLATVFRFVVVHVGEGKTFIYLPLLFGLL